jgi:hypothetical protein
MNSQARSILSAAKNRNANKGPGLGDQLLGGIEGPLSIASGAMAWPLSKIGGGTNLLVGMLRGDDKDELMREVAQTEATISNALTYQPSTASGRWMAQGAGHAIEKALDVPLKAANVKGDWYKGLGMRNITEVDPRAGWIAGLAVELAAFKVGHKLTKPVKAKIKRLSEKLIKIDSSEAQRAKVTPEFNEKDFNDLKDIFGEFKESKDPRFKSYAERFEGAYGDLGDLKNLGPEEFKAYMDHIDRLQGIKPKEEGLYKTLSTPEYAEKVKREHQQWQEETGQATSNPNPRGGYYAVGSHDRPVETWRDITPKIQPRTPEQLGAALRGEQTIPRLTPQDLMSPEKYAHLTRDKTFRPTALTEPVTPPFVRPVAAEGSKKSTVNVPLVDKENQPTRVYQVGQQGAKQTAGPPVRKTKINVPGTKPQDLPALLKSIKTAKDSGAQPTPNLRGLGEKAEPKKVEPVKVKSAQKSLVEAISQKKAEKTGEVTGEKAATRFNESVPGNSLKYDGEMDLSVLNKPNKYQFTAYEGPAKGATFMVDDLKPETIKAKLDEMIEIRKPKAEKTPIERKPEKIGDKIGQVKDLLYVNDQIDRLAPQYEKLKNIPKRNLTDEQRYIVDAYNDYVKIKAEYGNEKPVVERTPGEIGGKKVESSGLPTELDNAQKYVQERLPQVKAWLEGDQAVNIDKLKNDLVAVTHSFDQANPKHVQELLAPVDNLLAAINRKQIKAGKVEDYSAMSTKELIDLVVRGDRTERRIPSDDISDVVAGVQITRQEKPKSSITPKQARELLESEVIETMQEKQKVRVQELAEAKEAEPKKRLSPRQKKLKQQLDDERYLAELAEQREKVRPIEGDEVDLYGGRDMVADFLSLFDDERGSFSTKDLSPEKLAALQRIVAKIKREGGNLSEYLAKMGLGRETIAQITKIAEEAQDTARELKNTHKLYTGDPNNIIKRKPTGKFHDGKRLYEPGVREILANAFLSMPKIGKGELYPFTKWFKTGVRAFEKLGPRAKEVIYDRYIQLEGQIARRIKKITDKNFQVEKQFNAKEKKRIWTYMMSLVDGPVEGTKDPRGISFLKAAGITEIPKLTEKESKAVEYIRQQFKESLDQTNKMRISIGKKPIKEIDNYISFMREYGILDDLGLSRNLIFTEDARIKNAFAQASEKNVSFAHRRKRTGTYKLVQDPFLILERYLNSAVRHQELSPFIGELRQANRGFMDAEGNFYAPFAENHAAFEFIRRFANDIGDMPKTELGALQRPLRALSRNIAVATLSGNIRSAMIQPAALVNTYIYLGVEYTAKGILANMRSKSRKHAMFTSDQLNARQLDVTIEQASKRLKFGGSYKKLIANITLDPLKILDMESARSTWLGAWMYGRDKLGITNETKLKSYADTVVAKTQASALKGDRAPIQNTPLGAAATVLQTFVINNWDFLVDDVIKGRGLTRVEQAKRIYRTVLGYTLLTMLYEDVLGIKSPVPTPIKAAVKGIENDDDFLSIVKDVGAEFGEVIPVIGSLKYGGTALGPLAELVSETPKDIARVMEGSTSGKIDLAKDILTIGGVPFTGQAAKTLKSVLRGDEAQGLLPELVGPAGDVYTHLMGPVDYERPRKKTSSGFGGF